VYCGLDCVLDGEEKEREYVCVCEGVRECE